MKLRILIKEQKEKLPSKINAYHVGRELEGNEFSFKFFGSGEGAVGAKLYPLGKGLYFASDKQVALGYAKYHRFPFLYSVQLDTTGFVRGGEPNMTPEKAKKSGITGFYVTLPVGGLEICVFELSNIEAIERHHLSPLATIGVDDFQKIDNFDAWDLEFLSKHNAEVAHLASKRQQQEIKQMLDTKDYESFFEKGYEYKMKELLPKFVLFMAQAGDIDYLHYREDFPQFKQDFIQGLLKKGDKKTIELLYPES